MLRSRLLWRLYLGYFALIVLTASILGGLIFRQIKEDSLEEIQISLRTNALFLREFAGRRPTDESSTQLQDRIRTLGREMGARLTVIAADGAILADSDQDPAGMDNQLNRPEILRARSHGLDTRPRLSDIRGAPGISLALPVGENSGSDGYIRVSMPLSAVDERLERSGRAILGGTIIVAAVALILGLLVARRLFRPLISMTRIADSMAKGDYGQRVSIARTDEIGELGEALNRMARSLQRRMETFRTDHNQLLAILGGMAEGVVAVDENERVLHMNEAAGRILGADPSTSLGKPVWETTRIPQISETISQTLRDGTGVNTNLELRSSPRDRSIELRATPLRNGDHAPAGAVVVMHDVSERLRVETMRQDFVANVSHELKTPVAAIRALVETILEDTDMTNQTRDRFLRKTRNQSLRLSAIVSDLLTLSRMESQEGVSRETVDLRDTVAVPAEEAIPTAEVRGVQLHIQVPENPLWITGDMEGLCLVTSNLVGNALKYTPRAGEVTVSLSQQGDQALLEVEDSGIGIEARHLDRIFERFYRVDTARSRELGGTGLGLSIVKRVVLAHSGTVSVESIPGQGSRFRVLLPVPRQISRSSVS